MRIPKLWEAWYNWNKARQQYEDESEGGFYPCISLRFKCEELEAVLQEALDEYILEAVSKHEGS